LSLRKSIMAVLAVVVVSAWLFIMGRAFFVNPSASDSAATLLTMKTEAKALLSIGGVISESWESAKYGGAHLTFKLKPDGWTSELLSKYEQQLLKNRWVRLSGDPLEYCKEGVLLQINSNSNMPGSEPSNSMVFSFDAKALRRCDGSRA
jgi:hypothetical protein